jgi:pimeloyl-ACP methyl ester carboxylesterase
MTAERIHHATSPDGTDIAGHVRGQGPPLVLIHAGLGDSDLDCGELASLLSDRFTCYLPSTRSRGLSGHSDDLGTERHIEDVVAFVDSIGEPTGVATWSGGATDVLAAAQRTAAVSAVALHEPLVFELLDEEGSAGLEAAVAHMADLAEQGKLTEAARDWMTDWANAEEMASLEASGYFEAVGPYVPVLLGVVAAFAEEQGPSPTDPAELARIGVPVLVLRGSQTTRPWMLDSVRHVVEHVPDARVREVPGAGHSSMAAKPKTIADELARFFAA